MAYETTTIAPNANAVPTQTAPVMREERVVEPYNSKPWSKVNVPMPDRPTNETKTVPRETVGQTNINSDAESLGEAPASTPEESVRLSPQMAALARKEQKFRREEQEFKAKEAQLELERKEIAELKALKAKLEAKDFSGIESFVPYDAYTNYLIEKTETASPEALALKKLSEEVEGVKRAQKDDVEKRFNAAVQERKKAVNSLVESNPEFASIKELKMQDAVLQHILDTWEHDGVDLSPEDAAKEVEAELIDRAKRWTTLSKLKSTSQENVELQSPDESQKKQLPPLKGTIKTLTNNMAVTGEIKRPAKSFSNMSDSERYAEARRRAEEKLKSQGRL